MPEFLIYSLKVSVGLIVVFLFYQIALRNLTFLIWSRWYFMLGTLVAFIIPAIATSNVLQQLTFQVLQNFNFLPSHSVSTGQFNADNLVPENKFLLSGETWGTLFWIGLMIALARLLLQFLTLYKTYKSATLINKEDARIYSIDKNIAPFSFGKAIFLKSKELMQKVSYVVK